MDNFGSSREKEISVNLTYPRSEEYEFLTKIEVLDLDLEAKIDIANGTGFEINEPMNSNKKDMKNINGM